MTESKEFKDSFEAYKKMIAKASDDNSVTESFLDKLLIGTNIYMVRRTSKALTVNSCKISDVTIVPDHPRNEIFIELETTPDAFLLGRFNIKDFNVYKESINYGQTLQKLFFKKIDATRYFENLKYDEEVKSEEYLAAFNRKGGGFDLGSIFGKL